MAKLTLKDITSGFLATQTINDNNALIEALVETFLSRDGLAPNTMLATLDMNSNRIINTVDPVDLQDVATKAYVDAILASGIADQTGNAGLFLTTDGSTTSWADPLPDQTGNAGFFLTTDGTVASWAGGDFLPSPLLANRLVSNDGATPAWRTDFLLTTNTLAGDNANAGALLNAAASSTVPTVVGDKADTDSGLTSAGVDTPGMVAGGVLAISWAEASSEVLQASQMTTGLTASATQTQGQAPLFSSYNQVSVVANANDVVTLPAATIGRICTVVNNGVNDLQIFPASTEDLGAGVDTSVVLSPDGTLQLLGTAAGVWQQAFNLGLFGDFTDTQFCASNTNGPCMQNEASSLTNPTFIPDQTAAGAGLGGVTNVPAIISLDLPVATFTGLPLSVNYLSVVNNVTGFGPTLTPAGTDADIDINLVSLAAGNVVLQANQSATVTAPGGNVTITAGPGGATSGDGGSISIDGGATTTSGEGGIVTITGGSSAASAGDDGADVFLTGGTGNATGGNATLSGGIAGTNAGGGQARVLGAAGNGTGAGGIVTLTAGTGGTTGAGGAINITAGLGGATSGNGGRLDIDAGDANGSGSGGTLDLTSGDGAGTSGGGPLFITSGTGATTGNGGALQIRAGVGGASAGGDGGAASIGSGAAGEASSNSGSMTVLSGSGGGTSGNSGDVIIQTGSAGGTAGAINFNTGGANARLVIDNAGLVILQTTNGRFTGDVAGSGAILNEVPSGLNPTVVPSNNDLDTGLGTSAGNTLNAIAGGATSMTWTSSLNTSQRDFETSASGSGRMRNVTAGITTATVVPDKGSTTTGMGGAGGTVAMISGGVRGTSWTTTSGESLQTHDLQTGITAFATGGQGSATQLQNSFSDVTTVATAGDSVKLTVAAAGVMHYVYNAGAAALDIFPATGDNLGAGVDTAVSLAVNTGTLFMGVDTTNWRQWF